MKWMLWAALIVLGAMPGIWMTLDGFRRLVTGDYVRINGQLGPWRHLFERVGIDPMGVVVATLFVACGVARLVATGGLAARARWGWEATLLAAVATLWFIPFGTVTALLTLMILFVPAVRGMFGS